MLAIDAAQQLIETIERGGGRFELDLRKCEFVFEPGQAPARVVRAVFREKNRVMQALLARAVLAKWQPPDGERVQ